MWVATTRMKWETLQHHKEATFINAKGNSKVETNNLENRLHVFAKLHN
jgi:hypothetical protein